MPQTAQTQSDAEGVVEPKLDSTGSPQASDTVQSVVLAVGAERGFTRLRGKEPEPSVRVSSHTHQGGCYRMVYPRKLATELIVEIARCLPLTERQIAAAGILEIEGRGRPAKSASGSEVPA